FTTYTRNLAHNIEENLRHLCGPEIERIEVINLHRWAMRFLRSQGFPVDIASDDEVNACWRDAVSAAGSGDWPEAFYRDEWEHVVKGREVKNKAEYLRVSRRGQGVRLSRPQRAAVWEVLAEFQRELDALEKMTWLDVVSQARLYLAEQGRILPYRAVVVDETQDLHPEELRLLRQIVPEDSNDLFLVGDAHQRIYGRPVVLSHCGINIRGRASKLRIN
ncbi:MAG: AAA family ATPase, partial [Delftia sp.]|nr:AAA family ATPase [Delftia sp.]